MLISPISHFSISCVCNPRFLSHLNPKLSPATFASSASVCKHKFEVHRDWAHARTALCNQHSARHQGRLPHNVFKVIAVVTIMAVSQVLGTVELLEMIILELRSATSFSNSESHATGTLPSTTRPSFNRHSFASRAPLVTLTMQCILRHSLSTILAPMSSQPQVGRQSSSLFWRLPRAA